MVTRSVAKLAREIQRVANRRDLARQQQDRDQILFTLHSGNSKGASALERYASRAEALAVMEETMAVLVREMRQALDDLTPSQGMGKNQSATSEPRKRKRDRHGNPDL